MHSASKIKRIISFITAFAMILSVMPLDALAKTEYWLYSAATGMPATASFPNATIPPEALGYASGSNSQQTWPKVMWKETIAGVEYIYFALIINDEKTFEPGKFTVNNIAPDSGDFKYYDEQYLYVTYGTTLNTYDSGKQNISWFIARYPTSVLPVSDSYTFNGVVATGTGHSVIGTVIGLPPIFVPTCELVKTVRWHPHSFLGLATS